MHLRSVLSERAWSHDTFLGPGGAGFVPGGGAGGGIPGRVPYLPGYGCKRAPQFLIYEQCKTYFIFLAQQNSLFNIIASDMLCCSFGSWCSTSDIR